MPANPHTRPLISKEEWSDNDLEKINNTLEKINNTLKKICDNLTKINKWE